MPDTPKPSVQAVNPADLIKKANALNTTEVKPNTTLSAGPQAEKYTGQDGRTYYKYVIEGQELVCLKPLEEMTEQDFYDLPVAAYDIQAGRLPLNLVAEFHDPHIAGYWVNCFHKNGIRVNDARARGFVPAHRDDLKFVADGIDTSDGSVKQNDLILMKIHKAKLYMRYKEAMDIAKVRGNPEHYRQMAENAVNQKYFGFDLTKQAKTEFQGLGPVQQIQQAQENR